MYVDRQEVDSVATVGMGRSYFHAARRHREKGASGLEADVDRRAAVFVRENGKPLAQARGELLGVPKRQQMALDNAAHFDDERRYAAAN
jgi:hypothetical protein